MSDPYRKPARVVDPPDPPIDPAISEERLREELRRAYRECFEELVGLVKDEAKRIRRRR